LLNRGGRAAAGPGRSLPGGADRRQAAAPGRSLPGGADRPVWPGLAGARNVHWSGHPVLIPAVLKLAGPGGSASALSANLHRTNLHRT